eukprot:UN31075
MNIHGYYVFNFGWGCVFSLMVIFEYYWSIHSRKSQPPSVNDLLAKISRICTWLRVVCLMCGLFYEVVILSLTHPEDYEPFEWSSCETIIILTTLPVVVVICASIAFMYLKEISLRIIVRSTKEYKDGETTSEDTVGYWGVVSLGVFAALFIPAAIYEMTYVMDHLKSGCLKSELSLSPLAFVIVALIIIMHLGVLIHTRRM